LKFFPKKKAVSTPLPSTRVKSLTAEIHVLKQMTLRYLVDKSMSIREVANKLKTTPRVIKSFLEDPIFLKDLEERIEKVHGIDTSFRIDQAKITLSHLYEELRQREIENGLINVPVRDLHKMIVDTQKELRLDTPGEFTSKVGVADLSRLQDRYKSSLSGKKFQRKREKEESDKKRLSSGKVTEPSKADDESDQSSARGLG